jgi:hypothetical protein
MARFSLKSSFSWKSRLASGARQMPIGFAKMRASLLLRKSSRGHADQAATQARVIDARGARLAIHVWQCRGANPRIAGGPAHR